MTDNNNNNNNNKYENRKNNIIEDFLENITEKGEFKSCNFEEILLDKEVQDKLKSIIDAIEDRNKFKVNYTKSELVDKLKELTKDDKVILENLIEEHGEPIIESYFSSLKVFFLLSQIDDLESDEQESLYLHLKNKFGDFN